MVAVWVVLGLGVLVFGAAVAMRLVDTEPAGKEDAEKACTSYRAAVKMAGVEDDSLVRSMTAFIGQSDHRPMHAVEQATAAAEKNGDYRPLVTCGARTYSWPTPLAIAWVVPKPP